MAGDRRSQASWGFYAEVSNEGNMELIDAKASFFYLKGECQLKKRFDKKSNIHKENKEVNSKIKQPVIKRVRFHRLSEKKK